ncbi:MAG TPA: DegT/DnrJ/EryC1/StrS family aminotransferase [Oculatellaceae cyanobacterium]
MDSLTRRIPIGAPCFNGNEKQYLMECIDSAKISATGRFVDEFERQFAQYCEASHAFTCSSGTAALHLALMAHDVKPGDEIIVPSLTYIAAANAVTYCGAKPVFIDSEKDTWNLDPALIERAITPRTKAIIPVHLYGHPCEMDPILEIAGRHNLMVIEDAGEAYGAMYRGKRVGSFGQTSTFSFYGNSIITSGEGGVVVTNDDDIAARVRLFRGQGVDKERKYWFDTISYNYRMSNLQAAVALAQLEKIDWHVEQRRRVAALYNKHLAALGDELMTQVEKPWVKHAYWMYSILLRKRSGEKRDLLMHQLAENGIETRPIFYPLHTLPPYETLHKATVTANNGLASDMHLPFTSFIAARGINLPTHATLSEKDIEFIVLKLKEHLRA